jgi:hypothetical protein
MDKVHGNQIRSQTPRVYKMKNVSVTRNAITRHEKLAEDVKTPKDSGCTRSQGVKSKNVSQTRFN